MTPTSTQETDVRHKIRLGSRVKIRIPGTPEVFPEEYRVIARDENSEKLVIENVHTGWRETIYSWRLVRVTEDVTGL